MSYRIRPAKSLTGEVVRRAETQYRKAIASLREQPDGRDEAIHEARKRFKRLRGLFRLVRFGAPGFYARENARIRDVAGSLSTVRDATALIEVLDRLIAGDNVTVGEETVLRAVHQRLTARRNEIAANTDLDARIAAALEACAQGIKALDDLSLPNRGGKAVEALADGAAGNYRRAARAFALARKTDDREDWHELRKRIKYHWMHMRLLRAAWPGVMEVRADMADRAAELLGDDHDLSVLADLIETRPDTVGDADELSILQAAMERRSQRLRAEATEILEPLLRDRPRLVRSRIAALLAASASD